MEDGLSLICRLYGKLNVFNRTRIIARMLILYALQKHES